MAPSSKDKMSLDPLGSSKMSLDEKRELVYKLSVAPAVALNVLRTWTCDEIRAILRFESDKETKFTGLTKDEMIKKLLKIVSKKKRIRDREVEERHPSPKRQRKDQDPLHHVTPSAQTRRPKGLTKITFEDVLATSVTLVLETEESSPTDNVISYSVWHRKESETGYKNAVTCSLSSPNTRFVVSELTPDTDYCFKVVSFRGAKELSVDESKVSTPQEEEVVAAILDDMRNGNNHSPPPPSLETNRQGKRVRFQPDSDVRQIEKNTSSEEQQLVQEITPFSSDQVTGREDRAEKANKMEKSANFGSCFKECVKRIRQMECSGFLTKEFRQSFLSWYSLRSSAKETHVVKTFVDVFEDDSEALAEQLIDTFSGCISRKRSANGGGDVSGTGGASGAVI